MIPQKIAFVYSEIHALAKAALAEDVLAQKKEEMQLLAEIYIYASVKVGELLRQIPLGNRWDSPENEERDHFTTCDKVIKSKGEAIDAMGLLKAHASHYQLPVLYPDIVERAKRESHETKITIHSPGHPNDYGT